MRKQKIEGKMGVVNLNRGIGWSLWIGQKGSLYAACADFPLILKMNILS